MMLPRAELLLYAFWLGAALSLCGALLGVFRVLLSPGKLTAFALDVLSCLAAAVCTFLLALAGTNGRLRLYWFAFEVLGFWCVYVLCSRPLSRFRSAFRLFTARQTGKRSVKNGKNRGNGTENRVFFRKRREKNEKKT